MTKQFYWVEVDKEGKLIERYDWRKGKFYQPLWPRRKDADKAFVKNKLKRVKIMEE